MSKSGYLSLTQRYRKFRHKGNLLRFAPPRFGLAIKNERPGLTRARARTRPYFRIEKSSRIMGLHYVLRYLLKQRLVIIDTPWIWTSVRSLVA